MDILVQAGLAPSKSEARRLMKAGAVTLDGSKITDATGMVPEGLSDSCFAAASCAFARSGWSDFPDHRIAIIPIIFIIPKQTPEYAEKSQ